MARCLYGNRRTAKPGALRDAVRRGGRGLVKRIADLAYCDWHIAKMIIEHYQSPIDHHQLAREKTAALHNILFDYVTALSLIDVVKRYHNGGGPIAPFRAVALF